MTSLVQLELFINNCTSILRTRLKEFAKTGALIEISHWMQCYAFDVIGEITVRHFLRNQPFLFLFMSLRKPGIHH